MTVESHLEQAFALAWRVYGLPSIDEPVREYRFAPPRRFRFDFAFVDQKVAIEIEGGTWSQGRHSRGSGMSKDAEKYNLATEYGWSVLRYTSDMLTDPHAVIEQVVRVLKSKGAK